MSDSPIHQPDEGPLTEAYRAIRTISPPEAPFVARLARAGDEVIALAAAEGMTDWPGWHFGGAQHVCGALDVARRSGGNDLVLPWCTERIDVFVARRAAANAPLGGGEAVTLAVSAMRGTIEVHAGLEGDAPSPIGEWWLTDAGRPVFVHAVGASGVDSVESGAGRVIVAVAAACANRVVARLLEQAATACERPRQLSAAAGEWEERLFATCAPQPLATTVFPAARARDVAPDVRGAGQPAPRGEPAPGRLREAIARHIDGEFADTFSVAVRGAVRAMRGRLGRGRRRPWIAAAGIAGAIVVGGALWPSGASGMPGSTDGTEPSTAPTSAVAMENGGATAGDGGPGAGGPADAGLSDAVPGEESGDAPDVEAGTEPAPGADNEDPAAEAERLLDGLGVCRAGGTERCLDDILEPGAAAPPAGVVDLRAADRVVTLIDDYEGVAVLRVEATAVDEPPQLVVIVRVADEWLLRDVYDVAEQPSG